MWQSIESEAPLTAPNKPDHVPVDTVPTVVMFVVPAHVESAVFSTTPKPIAVLNADVLPPNVAPLVQLIAPPESNVKVLPVGTLSDSVRALPLTALTTPFVGACAKTDREKRQRMAISFFMT